ncbi:MAG: MBOAT family O-acyltransferase [Pseudomonadota bacterium]
MIFNSFEFITFFLPLALAGFLLADRIGGRETLPTYVAGISILFYAQFSHLLAVILCSSILLNYLIGSAILKKRADGASGKILIAGIVANIVALGYFKYANFMIDMVNDLARLGVPHADIILPVGISFYTFVQIGYLLDCHGGSIEERPTLMRYTVFAAFFPAVTAGPLVLSKEMFGQMERWSALEPRRIGVGLAIFAAGLFKKVVLADAIAPFADGAFNGVAAGEAINASTAWAGSLAYTLQLYFDFSGYSDMAIGLGLMFGLRLPLNFNSPFKATSISDFWRRWHMTMTRFFTTYLYTPMAMNGMRKVMAKAGAGDKAASQVERYIRTAGGPVLFTFIIAGIWHGAGWTFVVYGVIHGVALAINHAWREFKMPEVNPLTGWLLTMGVVVSGLVVFRAPDMATAMTFWVQMWTFGALSPATTGVELELADAFAFIIVLGAMVLFMPNTQQLTGSDRVSSDDTDTAGLPAAMRWSPSAGWAAATALVMVVAMGKLGADASFLYYQF